MERFVLTDAQWAKMESHCLGKATDPGRSGTNNRLFVEAALDRAHRQPLAGLAGVVRQMELGLRPLLYRGWGQG